jgi:hypothetical protein
MVNQPIQSAKARGPVERTGGRLQNAGRKQPSTSGGRIVSCNCSCAFGSYSCRVVVLIRELFTMFTKTIG